MGDYDDDRFLRIREILQRLGISRANLWRMIKRKQFPELVQISPGTKGIPLRSFRDWMKQRVAGAPIDRSS
jgi:predicted DNA-binding transcriptional regulator AlpA